MPTPAARSKTKRTTKASSPKTKPTADKTLAAVRSSVAAAERASSAAARHAEDLLALIARKKQQIGEAFYDIGVALRELQKKKLYVALGYSSFAAMLAARDVMSSAQAFKLVKLVSSVPREEALAVGQEKAFALVRYAEATPEVDTPGTLLASGALPGGKKVAEASLREIERAVQQVRRSPKKKPSAEKMAADQEAAAVQAVLRKRGARDAAVTALRSDGKWWLRAQVLLSGAAVLSGKTPKNARKPRAG